VACVLSAGRRRQFGNDAEADRRVLLVDVPANRDLQRAFASLRHAREEDNHIAVTLRASFATWAPLGETRKLRRRASTLSQRIEAWGNCRATPVVGDPLEGVMSSVPGLSLGSTAPPSVALLGDALAMLPWNRTASPWERGSVLFRQPNGAMWPYDPSGGSKRPQVLDIFVARRVRASRFWRIRSILASVLARPCSGRMVRRCL